jgi:hypothetical protein
MNHLLVWQKVNHFADSKQLTRKDLLKRNLQRFTDMAGRVSSSFEIMPQTFVLPHECVFYFHLIFSAQYINKNFGF